MDDLDLFLKIDGIEGECQDVKHKGELQLRSFEDDVLHTINNDGTKGRSAWPDANFTMFVDKSYPKLFQSCVNAEPLKKAVLIFRKAGKQQQEFLKITFSDVLVTRCAIGAAGVTPGNVIPVVSFAINFVKIEEEYRTQKDDGSLSGVIAYAYSISEKA